MAWLISLNLARSLTTTDPKESFTVFQCRLINHNRGTLCLDALHDTLNRALAKIIAVTLHGQTVNTNSDIFLLVFIKLIFCIIAVVASQFQNTVCNEVFSCSITLNDCFNQVLWNISIVSQ